MVCVVGNADRPRAKPHNERAGRRAHAGWNGLDDHKHGTSQQQPSVWLHEIVYPISAGPGSIVGRTKDYRSSQRVR